VRRIHRLQKLAASTPEPPALPAPGERKAVVALMAQDFRESVESFTTQLGWTAGQAIEQTAETPTSLVEEARGVEPELLSAFHLRALMVKDPDAALAKWQASVEAAREHLRSGEHAWETVAPLKQSPWELAEFIALRRDLIADLQPCNALEQMLIDNVIQVQFMIDIWYRELIDRHGVSNLSGRREPGEAPRVEDVEAIDQALRVIGQLSDIMLRTMNTLQRMRGGRGGASRVVVRRARQVNVGGQQINIGGGSSLGPRPQGAPPLHKGRRAMRGPSVPRCGGSAGGVSYNGDEFVVAGD
jgi:hypothetical protein